MDHPLISIIIPAYNAGETIQRACMSVFNQTYPNLELLVIDDGSQDETGKLVKQMACDHPQLKYYHQENGGVCKARNTGLDHAVGEYISFLDADDEMLPNCLEALLEIARTKNCDLVAGTYDVVRSDGSIVPQRYDAECIWKGQEAFENALKDHPAAYCVWGKLYRRDILKNIRFVEGRRIHEDGFFLFELLQQNVTMAVSDVVTIRYFMTKNSASGSQFSDKHLDILYFADKEHEVIVQNYPEYLPLAKNILVKANMAILRIMWSARDPKYKEIERQCLRTVRENASYFIPAIKVDKIMFLIIRLHLFWLYKLVFRMLRR